MEKTIKRFSKREKIITLICIAAVGGIIFKTFIMDPLRSREENLSIDIDEKEKLMIKNLISINRMKDQENEYNQYLNFLNSTQSEKEEMSGMLSEVEQVAGEAGIKILQMKPRKVRSVDFYQKSSLEISAEAGLPGLLNFFYHLEGSPRPFIVEEVRMEKKPTFQGESVILNCNLTVSRIFVTPGANKKGR